MTQQTHESTTPIDPITDAIQRADLYSVIQLVGSHNVSEVLSGGQSPLSLALQTWHASDATAKQQYQSVVAYFIRLNPQVIDINAIAQDQEL